MKLKKHHKYEIQWIDTYSYNGWYDEKDIDKKTNNHLDKTIGFFVKETKDFIIMCMTFNESDSDFLPYNSPKWIPKGFIKQIRELK